ncbi:tetratricopeptide repeat protein [Pseudanabaena sp. PCC 6802]|uniref:tetratricopeptide repeat protein n=1 Tax=Pseudanabaena sp. PCC 6802 TaxID=118173 RepID=UPI00034AD6BC|nr:tetratricopeptide repeat protein [Pseudanabaena sp. PCC 6802]
MAKKRFPKLEQRRAPITQDGFQTQLQSLLRQQKYRQAIEEIRKALRVQPDLKISPSEAEIWLLRGKQEFQKKDFKQAAASFQCAVQLGLTGEVHYWLAKSLLERDLIDDAIAQIQPAFADGSLPKEYSICYAKLLLLKGDTEAVEQLLSQQVKRFPSAHQNWLRGVLALKAEQPKVALTEFQKVKQPVTQGDRPDIWQIYTQQVLQNWEAAAQKLGLDNTPKSGFSFDLKQPAYAVDPRLMQLALLQKFKTGKPSLQSMRLNQNSQASIEMLRVIDMLELIDEDNLHDAAHVLLKLDRRSTQFPEVAAMRPSLLLLAGQQAMIQGEMSCASEFLQLAQREQPFDPQRSVNLMKVLDLNEDYQELQLLITKLLKWLEREIEQNPHDWSDDRRKATLAYGYCRLADTWIAMGRERTAMGSLQTAERIWADSPEVKGRRGLVADMEGRYDDATQLLTQALEEGCRSQEVYGALLEIWKNLGKPEVALETRRRFGKRFGDLSPEADIEVLPWVDALSTGSYPFFSRLVKEASQNDPAMRACQIFVELARGETKDGQKIVLDQSQAVQKWDALLQGRSPKESVPILQAIALCLQMFAKREKGIAALITQYMLKLSDLRTEHPEAAVAYLTILALKERDLKKLEIPFQSYLRTVPQPGNALAQIQLHVRRYAQTILQDRVLSPSIEDALSREPQNPLLLLAKATTYPIDSPHYEEFKQQGFEIARRLQDAKALQAFREEEAFLSARYVQEAMPSPERFDDFDMGDLEDLLDSLIGNMLGGKVPQDELKRMLPDLKRMMMNDLPDFEEEEEDSGFGFGFPFGGFPGSKKSSKPRRRG